MSKGVGGLLRWTGSKRHMLALLSLRVPQAKNRYFEPFAGSACLFFASQPERAVLADLNGELISMYRAVRRHPRRVARKVHAWKRDAETFYKVRSLSRADLDPVDRAARFVYLNRLCFNGVYRTNRRGEFNVPFGNKTGRIPDEESFVECSRALRGIDLRNGDFESTTIDACSGDVVYLDPPYTQHPEKSYGVYGYGAFQSTDFERLVKHLRSLDSNGAAVVLSYTDIPEVHDAFDPGWEIELVEGYSQVAARTSSRRLRREILVTNRHARELVS